jgi:aryl-alcohol dehydrogenase-like predicted oxidoreductase
MPPESNGRALRPMMETVCVGHSGLKVSQLCLGTMIFGGPVVGEAESFDVLDAAEEMGIDFLDVADIYPSPISPATWGQCEELVGRWLLRSSGRRERFVVATKFGDRVGPGANDTGGSRKHVIEACDASLRRLNTDRIDLYWMHKPDPSTPLEETIEALDSLIRAGKVHYVGASNFEAWRLGLALALSAERRAVRFAAIQCRWSLLERRVERELLPLCLAAGIAVVPYNPLAGGLLTGRYQRDRNPPPRSRYSAGALGEVYRERYWSEAGFDVADLVVETARRDGVAPAQLALAWVLSRTGVTSPIIGASRRDQLRENIQALQIQLSPDTIAALDNASALFV